MYRRAGISDSRRSAILPVFAASITNIESSSSRKTWLNWKEACPLQWPERTATASFLAEPALPAYSSTAFVAPGQGSQWLGMATELFESATRSFARLLKNAMLPSGGNRLEPGGSCHRRRSSSHIAQIDVIQPSLFAMSVALAAMWQSWGITPDAVIGHSMGEVAAAYIADFSV